MVFSWISQKDIIFLREHQPQLIYDSSYKSTLSGFLYFKAQHFGKEIEDRYKIDINFSELSPLPLVREVGGRIQEIAQKKNKTIKDLHINDGEIDKGVCLCSRIKAFDYYNKFKESDAPTTDFIIELIIPFFYGLSYFDKFNEYPFGELEHGIPGLIKEINNNIPLFLKYSEQYQKDHPKEFHDLMEIYFKQNKPFCEINKIK